MHPVCTRPLEPNKRPENPGALSNLCVRVASVAFGRVALWEGAGVGRGRAEQHEGGV